MKLLMLLLAVYSAFFCIQVSAGVQKLGKYYYKKSRMAEDAEQIGDELQPIDNEEPPETPGYKPPAQQSLDQIKNLDADDESLVRYKQALLGQTGDGMADEGGSNVQVKTMIFRASNRDDRPIDLLGDLSKLKDKPIVIKEGAEFRIVIVFQVKREIVSGLKYFHVVSRKGIRVDRQQYMVGSYGPKTEAYHYQTPPDEAPKGIMARGHYTVKSKFLDDDKNVYLEWEWAFDIKKDWE